MKKLPDNQIAFYQSPDGSVNIEVLYAEENIWLTQKKMAELFDCSTDNISLHLKNIYQENEVCFVLSRKIVYSRTLWANNL